MGSTRAADSAAILKLIDAGWQPTASARAAADREYAQLANDPRALAAYWLVLMQQQRYNDALKHLDEYLEKQGGSWMALHAKTWVQAVLHKDDEALISAERLGELIAAQSASTSQSSSQDDCVRFLGRFFAYLSGPGEDEVDQVQREKVESKITARFDETRKELFAKARDEASKKFAELTQAAEEAEQDTKKQTDAEREKAKAALEDNREEIKKKADEVAEAGKKLAEEFKKKQEALKSQFEGLERAGNRISQQALQARQQRENYGRLADKHAADAQAAKRNPSTDRAYQDAKARERMAENQQRTLEMQMQQNINDRNLLMAKNNELIGQANAQGVQISKQLGGVEADKRKLQRKEKKAQTKTASNTKALALENQARAFKTYDTFPLERYKGILVEALKKSP